MAATHCALRRMAREGMVLRALGGPAALLTGTVLLTAVGVVAAPADAPVAVADAALVDKLGAADIAAVHSPDPLAALQAGETDRAVADEDGAQVVHLRPTGWSRWSARRGHSDLLLESVVREHVGAGWRLEVDARPGIGRELPRHVRTLLRMLGVLFTLYAVVLVVAAAVRDREDGTLEALGATATPTWVGPLARGLAVYLAVGGSLMGSQLLLGALFGLEDILALVVSGQSAGLAAVGVGTLAPAGRAWRAVGPFTGAPDGLSVPLSRGLVAAMALAGVGWSLPGFGAGLPIASLVAPAGSTLSVGVAVLLSIGVAAASVLRAGSARW